MSVLNAWLAKVVTEIINPLILLMSAGAFVVFAWGAFQFILHAGDASEREKGRKAILWGVIGFAIIFGVYGILNIALGTVGLDPVQKISQ